MTEQSHGLEADVLVSTPAGKVQAAQAAYLASLTDKQIKRILVLIAMEAEAAPLIQALGLVQDTPRVIPEPAPCVSFSGSHAGAHVHVVVNGKCGKHGVDNVGTVPAALTAYLALQAFDPDLVISTGTAGGFGAQGAAIGDVFLSTATVNHDRRIPIPGFDQYGLGLHAALPTPQLQAALGLKAGLVSSGNSLDYVERDMEIMREHDTSVKEMEAAAIAWSASLFGVPMFSVKAITDIDEFLENLATAAASLQQVLPQVLHYVSGKRYREL